MKKTKMLKVDEKLFHILKIVKVSDETWSATARQYLWDYCRAVYPDAVDEIIKSYQLGKEILKKDKIAAEVIRDDL